MKCIKCFESINEEATKCHHCKSWQSSTGFMSETSERFIVLSGLIIIFSILVFVLKVNIDSNLQQRFQILDKTSRLIALDEYANNKLGGQKRLGDGDVNLFNYSSLYQRTIEINEIILSGNVPAIYDCFATTGNKCNKIKYNKTHKVSTVIIDDVLSDVEKIYLMNLLSKLSDITSIRVGNNSAAVTWQ